MAERLGVASRVLFCGPLFDAAKWEAYRDADVFVLPSQNENFGNTAAEAAAAGTPVVVTEDCGVAPLLAGIAGLVVPHDAEGDFTGDRAIADEPDAARATRCGMPRRHGAAWLGRACARNGVACIASLSARKAACHNRVPEVLSCSAENIRGFKPQP